MNGAWIVIVIVLLWWASGATAYYLIYAKPGTKLPGWKVGMVILAGPLNLIAPIFDLVAWFRRGSH